MTEHQLASVRFGSLRVAVSLGHERYCRAFDTHFRSILEPPLAAGEVPDLSIDVTDDGAPGSGPPQLEMDRGEESRRWRSPAGEVVVSQTTAHLSMQPGAMPEPALLFWFTVLIQKVLLSAGVVRLHAGAVAVGDRTAVFVGEKGAGKSTLALGLGQRGATVLGDDQLAVQAHGSTVLVAGSYPAIRLTADTEQRLLDAPLAVEPVLLAGVAKKEVPLDVLVPAAPFEPYAPTDLWFPTVRQHFDRAPIPRRDALDRLVRVVAPHHRFADNQDRADLLDILGALVEMTTPSEVSLPRDLEELDRAWMELTT